MREGRCGIDGRGVLIYNPYLISRGLKLEKGLSKVFREGKGGRSEKKTGWRPSPNVSVWPSVALLLTTYDVPALPLTTPVYPRQEKVDIYNSNAP